MTDSKAHALGLAAVIAPIVLQTAQHGKVQCQRRKVGVQNLGCGSVEQGGVFLYMRQEGRGIGLHNKLRTYELQDQGLDTVDANLALGFPADRRDYGIGMQILVDIGVRKMRLITNNPAKRAGLEAYGLEVVERVSIQTEPNPHNLRYLETKRQRMGHLLDGLEAATSGGGA